MKIIKAINVDTNILVSDEDFDYLSGYTWKIDWGVAVSIIGRMHHVVAKRMGNTDFTRVLHKDGNRLNNCRTNLEPTKFNSYRSD